MDPDQTAPIGSSLFWVHAVCFYSLFVSILGNYLQQTTSADDIFRCIVFLGALSVNSVEWARSLCAHTLFLGMTWLDANDYM